MRTEGAPLALAVASAMALASFGSLARASANQRSNTAMGSPCGIDFERVRFHCTMEFPLQHAFRQRVRFDEPDFGPRATPFAEHIARIDRGQFGRLVVS
jgi:hypothetical protein